MVLVSTVMEFIPIALACGHVLQGTAWFEMPAVGSGDPSLVECPEGCGMVQYVIEPQEGDDQPRRIIEFDLGYVEEGENISITIEPPEDEDE